MYYFRKDISDNLTYIVITFICAIDGVFDAGDYVGYITVCQENSEEVIFFEDNEEKVQEAIAQLKEKAIVTYVFGEK